MAGKLRELARLARTPHMRKELVVEALTNTSPQGSSKAKYTLADGTARRVHAGAAELLSANPLYPGLTL